MGQGKGCCGSSGACHGLNTVQLVNAEQGAVATPRLSGDAAVSSSADGDKALKENFVFGRRGVDKGGGKNGSGDQIGSALPGGHMLQSHVSKRPPYAALKEDVLLETSLSHEGAMTNSMSGELGTGTNQNDVFNTFNSNFSAFDTFDRAYEDMSRPQRKQARSAVKDFVKSMVKGREFSVVAANGKIRTCHCSLTRKLDKLKVTVVEKDKHKRAREIPLSSIKAVETGMGPDKGGSANDDTSVTLTLDTEEQITFRLPSAEARDELATCLTMFSNQARQSSLL